MVTVSIVVHETAPQQLTNAIGCILRAPQVSRVWIIDNSKEDSLRGVVSRFDKVEYVHVENRGFGAGHNIGIRKAKLTGSDYHLVMNADVEWGGDVISVLAAYMDRYADVGLTSPKIFYPDGQLQFACRMLPTPLDLFIKRFLPPRLVKRRMNRYLLAMADHDREFNCPYLLGSFMFFRMSALDSVGLFDERFFMYPEDIDISRRIHRKYRTMYNPEVSIIHAHAAESRKNRKMLWIHMTNMVKYFNKWGWFIDSERRKFNKQLLKDIPWLPNGEISDGRG